MSVGFTFERISTVKKLILKEKEKCKVGKVETNKMNKN